jgi:hypothetical protein
MTVLAKYQRLECSGTWRAEKGGQRQNVFVSLGEASLIIKDAKDMPLAHWSLPAVARINPGVSPALYQPGTDAGELLEIDDPDMIDAIGTVRRAVARAQPRRGRVRLVSLTTIGAAVLALAVFWLPEAVVRHTASVLPEATRADIGRRLLTELEPVAGRPCRDRAGRRVMAGLRRQLFGDAPWQVVVVPGGPAATAYLPGGLILLHQRMIEAVPGPEVTAGALLVEAARADIADPVEALLRDAGLGATLRLLTRGAITDAALAAHADGLLARPPVDPDPDRIAMRFADARVPPKPYLAQPDAVPFPPPVIDAPVQLMTDADWLRLQAICAR